MITFVRRVGLPYPCVVTPRTEDEARYGKPVLLTDEDLSKILGSLGEENEELIERLRDQL